MAKGLLDSNFEKTSLHMGDAIKSHNLTHVIQDIESARRTDPQHFQQYIDKVNASLVEQKLLPNCTIVGTEDQALTVFNRQSHKFEDMEAKMDRTVARNASYSELVKVPSVAELVGKPNLAESRGLVTSRADSVLAKETDAFNCHFYTSTHLLGHEPRALGIFSPPKALMMFEKKLFADHGYRNAYSFNSERFLQESSKLKEGDIILIVDPGKKEPFQETHSGVVLRSDANGGIIIRQKFDPKLPVVDLTANQFKQAYLNDSEEQVQVWTK
jgi:hypothetical protein